MYGRYGQYGKYGSYGAYGGVLKPPAISDLVFWADGSSTESPTVDKSAEGNDLAWVGSNALTFYTGDQGVDVSDSWNNAIKTNGNTGYFEFPYKPDDDVSTAYVFSARNATSTYRFEVIKLGKDLRFLCFFNGSTQTSIQTFDIFNAGTEYLIRIEQDGVRPYIFVDGVKITSYRTELLNTPTLWWGDFTLATDAKIGEIGAIGGANFTGTLGAFKFCKLDDTCLDEICLAEGSEINGVSRAGNDYTVDAGSGNIATMRAGTTEKAYCNMEDGFSLYENGSGGKWRAIYGLDGLPQTVTPPAGYTKTSDHQPVGNSIIHNGAETGFDVTGATNMGHSGLFFEADEVTPKIAYYDDIKAWVNWTDNTIVNCETVGGACLVKKPMLVYAADYAPTPTDVIRMANLAPNTCGAGTLEQVTHLTEATTYNTGAVLHG